MEATQNAVLKWNNIETFLKKRKETLNASRYTPNEKENQLIDRIVTKMAEFLQTQPILNSLEKKGYLGAQFLADNVYDLNLNFRTAQIPDLREVAPNLEPELRKKIKEVIYPSRICFGTDVNNQYIDQIDLDVSDCRKLIHLTKQMEVFESEPSYYRDHSKGATQVQKKLWEVEQKFQYQKVSMERVKAFAEKIFSSVKLKVFLEKCATENCHKKLKLVLTFNYAARTRIIETGEKKIIPLEDIQFDEILALIKYLNEEQFLPMQPKCSFESIDREEVENTHLSRRRNFTGLSTCHPRGIASYLLFHYSKIEKCS